MSASEENRNPFVFPQQASCGLQGGLRLRDLLAAMALHGLITAPDARDHTSDPELAYLAADAALEARQKTGEPT